MLINIPALLFLNSIPEITGKLLKKHMKIHHSDIIIDKRDKFLIFKYDAFDYKSWYYWTISLITMFITAFTTNYFTL
jgi:hypothetical protein